MIVCPSAKLALAERAILFAAVGTAGQRCTSLRRLFVHESVYDTLVPALKRAYARLPIGNPLEKGTLVGPLIDARAFEAMERALADAKDQGGVDHRRRPRARERIPERVLRSTRARRDAGAIGHRATRPSRRSSM